MSKNLLARYIRVSKEDEKVGESNSITNQRELLKAFAEHSRELSQHEVVEFCDDGYSGTNFDRPGVKALLQEVRAGNISCIIVKDLSRFGRNYIDIGDYLEQIFPFLGVRFISVNDHFDSSNFEGITGGLDVGFRNLIYALYSKDLSEKVRSAKKTQMEKGEFISSFAPYGYKKSLENRKKLVIDEEAASIVSRIFAMANEGRNAVQIAALLNRESIPTPYAYKRLKGCDRKYNVVGTKNYWHNTTILTIIRDERYTGKMVNGKNRSPVVGCKHGKRVPKSEWIIVPNTHEAIIPEELFASVQKRFTAPARMKTERTDGRLLLGKVKCGVCRHAMRRSKSTPAAAYYYCESHQYVTNSGCTKDRILESSLIQTVLSVIHMQTELMSESQESQKDITALTEQGRQLQVVLTRLEASRIKSYEEYRNGVLDRENYINHKADVTRQIAEAEAGMEELEATLQSSILEHSQPDSFIEGFTEHSKERVDEQIDCIYVYGQEAIEIVWNQGVSWS